MSQATLSTKGQIVIPRDIRRRQGFSAGTTFDIEVVGGCLILRPVREVPETTLEELLGCAGYEGPRKSLGDMADGIAAAARDRS